MVDFSSVGVFRYIIRYTDSGSLSSTGVTLHLFKDFNLFAFNKQYTYMILHHLKISIGMFLHGAKGDWDFRISDLVRNPDGTDI